MDESIQISQGNKNYHLGETKPKQRFSMTTHNGTTNLSSSEPRRLFSLNASYLISNDSEGLNLLDDALCFMSSALSVLREMDNEGNEGHKSASVYAAMYLIEMAENTTATASSRLTNREVRPS